MSAITPSMSGITTAPIIKISENEYERLRMKKDIGAELIKNIQQILREEDINFTGDLSTSFELAIFRDEAWVGTTNKYAGLVDRGLNPGTNVNFDAIKDWVRIKLDITEEPELSNVTWKIVRKSATAGIPPKRYAKKAIKMVIGKHGVHNVRRNAGSKRQKSGKFMKKVKKLFKMVKKTAKKINRGVKKSTRVIKKITRLQNKLRGMSR